MKILYAINALTVGGAQNLLIDLASYFAKSNNAVIVAAFRDGPLSEELKFLNCKVVILGESFFDIFAFYKLVELIRTFKPDIIHSHLFRATTWARIAKLATRSKTKLITTIHGAESDLYHIIESLTLPFSDFIIFPSQFLANWYKTSIKKLDNKAFKVIYPGVVIRPQRPFTSHSKPVIGTLSRLHSIKGLDILLKAAKLLKNKNVSFELRIGGDGKGKESLLNLVNQLKIEDVCQFLDEIPHKSDYLEKLDIFASPSRQEAFGINLCEAMERSLPIVASNTGGIPEVVEDGLSGLLTLKDDPEDLAEKLLKMINSEKLRKKTGEYGRLRVEKYFDRKKALEDHMELYEKILTNKSVHFAISSRELGGGERLAIDLIKNLQKRGWTVSATCAGNPLYKELLSLNIKCSVASMNFGGILFCLKLLKDLFVFKPSIISSHLNKASLFAGFLGKLMNIPCISHIHGLNKKVYYQFSHKLVAVSKAVKQHILDQEGEHLPLVVIRNSIDKPALSARGFKNKPLNIAITAKLHSNKGHQWALTAIEDSMPKLNLGEIHIFGEGPERSNLEKLCHSFKALKDKVIFHGFVDNPSSFYNNIDIALLPSLGEGIPLSLLEAMRFGIPCISTNIGGIPEIIVNNESGILVEPKDSESLLKAISRLSQKEDYEFFSKNAINRFKAVNDHKKMVDDFENLLLNSLKNHE